MTNETDVDVAGAGGNTTPPASKASVAGDATELSKVVESVVSMVLEKELRPLKGDISGLYSRQDKAENKFGDFLSEYNKAKASGQSDKEAQASAEQALSERDQKTKREKAIDLVLEKFGNELSAPVAGNDKGGADDVAKVFAKYGVDLNDPAAQEFTSLKGDALKAAVADYAFGQKSRSPLDPSEAPSLSGDPAPKQTDKGMIEQYQKDMIAARGRPSLLKQIKEDARKKGVPVDSIAFV